MNQQSLLGPSIYDTGMYKAVEAAGGVTPLAERLGVTRQAAHSWLLRGYAPPKRAIQIEEMFGIPRAELFDPRLRTLLSGSLGDVDSASATVPYRPR